MNYLKIFITLCFVLLVSCTVISYEEIEDETVGTTVSESSYLSGYMCEVEDSPYCEDSELKKLLEERSKPFLSWAGTRYDYDLDIPNWEWWSKKHDTCAMRVWTRYNYYKVCLSGTDKCIVCYLNDYGPKEYTYKVIDLSSHAFQQLAPLSRGVILVDIFELSNSR